MPSVVRIGIFREKKSPKELCDVAEFLEGGGIRGDLYAGDPLRGVSLLGIETREMLEQESRKGLCTAKFSENVTTQGIPLGALRAGARLRIGGAVLEITATGKECFAQCGMEDKSGCPLRTGCLFAKAVKGGIAAPGDEVTIV